jgi:hypothetical protein
LFGNRWDLEGVFDASGAAQQKSHPPREDALPQEQFARMIIVPFIGE